MMGASLSHWLFAQKIDFVFFQMAQNIYGISQCVY